MTTAAEARNMNSALIALGMAIDGVRENPNPHGRDFVFLPQVDGSVKVEYLERPNIPERLSGTVAVRDVGSFIAGTKRYFDPARTVVYGNLDPGSFAAVLNDHTHIAADWRDHRVSFALKHSKEFDTWKAANAKKFDQEEFAYFIEDNLPDFSQPSGAEMLETALNFRAKQGLSFKSGIRLQDGALQLEYIQDNIATAGKEGRLTIPEEFEIVIPVWEGLNAKKYAFKARFRYTIANGALIMRYELQRPHKVVEAAFIDVLQKVEEELSIKVIFGTP